MPIDEVKRIIDLSDPSAYAVLQEVLTDIHNKSTGVVYSEDAVSELDSGRLHIQDDGAGTQAVSIKTGKDNILTLSGSACGGAAGGVLAGTYPNPSFAAGGLNTTALKTSQGSVSRSAYSPPIVPSTLPGGEYGFFPQCKGSTGGSARHSVTIYGTVGIDASSITTSYTTLICIRAEGGETVSVQQRYVTASGTDHWVFLMAEKATNRIVGGYEAMDHPMYGNGGNIDLTPHPFPGLDLAKYEVFILPKQEVELYKQSLASGRGLLETIIEEFDPASTQTYEPMHTGAYIDKEPVLLKDLPPDVGVRGLVEISTAEKNGRKQEAQDKHNADKAKEQQTRASLKSKGFTDEELNYLKGGL
jgi:hypothetical protein